MKTTELTAGDKATLRQKFLLQAKCAQRWEAMLEKEGLQVPERIQTFCTLVFADRDCPIDFDRLLAAPDGDFAHDMSGLDRHMNRETCKLEGCFMPRCAFPSRN